MQMWHLYIFLIKDLLKHDYKGYILEQTYKEKNSATNAYVSLIW